MARRAQPDYIEGPIVSPVMGLQVFGYLETASADGGLLELTTFEGIYNPLSRPLLGRIEKLVYPLSGDTQFPCEGGWSVDAKAMVSQSSAIMAQRDLLPRPLQAFHSGSLSVCFPLGSQDSVVFPSGMRPFPSRSLRLQDKVGKFAVIIPAAVVRLTEAPRLRRGLATRNEAGVCSHGGIVRRRFTKVKPFKGAIPIELGDRSGPCLYTRPI